MFSLQQKRDIADAVQKILRDTHHPELPVTEIQFTLYVTGAEPWSWAAIRNNGAVTDPGVNLWNERQADRGEAIVIHKVNITGCARCGEAHADLIFLPFTRPIQDGTGTTHYSTCPVTKEPILMVVTNVTHVGDPDHLRAAIHEWCNVHMPCTPSPIDHVPVWEKEWHVEGAHKLIRLRIMGHNEGAWIILQSCSASYGADEDHWKGCNFGSVRSVVHMAALYEWLETQAGEQ